MTSEKKPTVWITRTAPAAFKSAAVWAEAGYAAAIAPVLELSEPKVMPELPVRDGVIIFTSPRIYAKRAIMPKRIYIIFLRLSRLCQNSTHLNWITPHFTPL